MGKSRFLKKWCWDSGLSIGGKEIKPLIHLIHEHQSRWIWLQYKRQDHKTFGKHHRNISSRSQGGEGLLKPDAECVNQKAMSRDWWPRPLQVGGCMGPHFPGKLEASKKQVGDEGLWEPCKLCSVPGDCEGYYICVVKQWTNTYKWFNRGGGWQFAQRGAEGGYGGINGDGKINECLLDMQVISFLSQQIFANV